MVKKKAPLRKVPTPPALQTWRVSFPSSSSEEVQAHTVETWDGALTFTTQHPGADGGIHSVVVRGFAPGQWLDYQVVADPTSDAA